MEKLTKPFDIHVLICTNTRPEGQKQSCGPLGADSLRAEIKEWLRAELKARPSLASQTKARVNGSGCLDFCAKGIALAIYPQGDFLLGLRGTDSETVKSQLRSALDKMEQAAKSTETKA